MIVPLLIIFLISVFWLVAIFPNRLQKVSQFRIIKVGDYVSSLSGPDLHQGKNSMFPPGRFFVIFTSDKVPVDANVDDRVFYKDISDFIVSKGGHYFCSGDPKAASVFGMKYVLSRDRSVFALARDAIERVLWDREIIAKRSNQWELDGSLVTITDENGKILSIYKNAKVSDIKKIVNDLQLK